MGEFAFIIAKQALDTGAVDNGFYSAVIGAALISMIALPFLSSSSGRMYDKITSKLPMGRLHRLSEKRDNLYAALAKLPIRMGNAMSKAAATIYANVIMIVIITVLFYLYNTRLGFFLSDFFSIDFIIVMIGLFVFHILVLLTPCYYLVKNLRVVMYVMDESRKEMENYNPEQIRFYQTMNPLIIAGALDVLLVVIIPDDYNPMFELVAGILIVVAIAAYQYWRFAKGKISKPVEIKEKKEPETEDTVADGTDNDVRTENADEAQTEPEPETETKS